MLLINICVAVFRNVHLSQKKGNSARLHACVGCAILFGRGPPDEPVCAKTLLLNHSEQNVPNRSHHVCVRKRGFSLPRSADAPFSQHGCLKRALSCLNLRSRCTLLLFLEVCLHAALGVCQTYASPVSGTTDSADLRGLRFMVTAGTRAV